MSQNNHHQHGFGHEHRSGDAYCVCPSCDHAMRHVPGVPCNARLCPDCGHNMFKSYESHYAFKVPKIEEEDAADFQFRPVKRSIYPIVITSKCSSCDSCIEMCPVDAIEYREGKAFIIEAKCRNCKACVNVCPDNAIEP